VKCGGGLNHRLGLYDAYLIKENHTEIGVDYISVGAVTKHVVAVDLSMRFM
jgi:nicotinate-nucleotide pyrophosphorylase